MPKAAQSPSSVNAANHPNVLKRNQACHQCRRRKLKCDAKRPCSTCVRSHAHALAHAPAGHQLPPYPECTFDDVIDSVGPGDGPKSRYEKLERRINELEALLRQKESAESNGQPSESSPGPSHSGPMLVSPSISHSGISVSSPLSTPPVTTVNINPDAGSLPALTDATAATQNAYFTRSQPQGTTTSTSSLIYSNWPTRLPEPDLLRHLVELFFVFHPHSNRLLHASSFLTTLSFPPHHPKFPSTPLLHAICAIGSLYTAIVTSPPLPNLNEVEPDELFFQRHRLKESRPDSFAEEHAKIAKELADRQESLGEDLFRVLQARIVLTWFYWSHSRWVEVFVTSAHALRLAVPLGLNILPPFQSITNALRPASILPPARTVVEEEMRRNAFWLAYANERLHGFGNGWALSMDDNDVCQLLPLRGDQFDQGVSVPTSERQWAQSQDLLLVHLPKQVDSFILYIKGTIMISQVKTFNMRFRARHLAGDVSVTSPYKDTSQPSEHIDPRGSQAFLALDEVVSTFRVSFPPHLRSPITDSIVDPVLYTASLMPHCASITLHDPHADVQQRGCISALKILTSARAILDLIYSVSSTSFDITLLEPFCVFSWFIGGRVLVRFLKAAQEANSTEQISTLRAELEFVHFAIAKVGERIPMAFRFAKMLRDLISNHCGDLPPIPFTDITFPRHSPEMLAGPGAELLQMYDRHISNSVPSVSLKSDLYDPVSYVSFTP
ncbi:Transcription factor domain-containing protein [Pleurotus pulmonarius]